jgi:hypothetical protein
MFSGRSQRKAARYAQDQSSGFVARLSSNPADSEAAIAFMKPASSLYASFPVVFTLKIAAISL